MLLKAALQIETNQKSQKKKQSSSQKAKSSRLVSSQVRFKVVSMFIFTDSGLSGADCQ